MNPSQLKIYSTGHDYLIAASVRWEGKGKRVHAILPAAASSGSSTVPDTQQMLRSHLLKQMTLSKLQSSWLSAHLVPVTVGDGARDMAVDKTHRCGPSCRGAHSQVG